MVGSYLLWEHTRDIDSKEALDAFHATVSLNRALGRWGSPHLFAATIPGLCLAVGLALAVYYGDWRIVRTPFLAVVVLNTWIAGELFLWLDRAGWTVIDRIRPAFATTDVAYYRLMGRMVERMYEPFPHTPRPPGRRVHLPFVGSFIFGAVLFVFVPIRTVPQWTSELIGLPWETLPVGVRLYFVALLLLANFVGVVTSWIVVTGTVYLGYRIRSFRIDLDITRTHDNLGLAPYATLVLRTLFLYLLAYLVTTILAFRDPAPIYLLAALIMSALPLLGFFGSQYGLHVAIRRSKRERLRTLREEFDDDIGRWFAFDAPEPTVPDDGSDRISEFIAAKRAIDDLPDWPINMGSVAQLTSATVASNLWIVLQVVGLIE